MKVVALKCRDGGAIQYVQELLRRCEAGEVVAVTAIEECRDGTYRVGGSSVSSRTQTAGMLLDAAVTRLADA